MKAVMMRATGGAEVVEYNRADSLAMMQAGVGGFIEHVRVVAGPTEFSMWVNEDGIRLQLPHNNRATRIYHRAHGYDKEYGTDVNPILGDVVFTGRTDAKGDVTELDEKWVDMLLLGNP